MRKIRYQEISELKYFTAIKEKMAWNFGNVKKRKVGSENGWA